MPITEARHVQHPFSATVTCLTLPILCKDSTVFLTNLIMACQLVLLAKTWPVPGYFTHCIGPRNLVNSVLTSKALDAIFNG